MVIFCNKVYVSLLRGTSAATLVRVLFWPSGMIARNQHIKTRIIILFSAFRKTCIFSESHFKKWNCFESLYFILLIWFWNVNLFSKKAFAKFDRAIVLFYIIIVRITINKLKIEQYCCNFTHFTLSINKVEHDALQKIKKKSSAWNVVAASFELLLNNCNNDVCRFILIKLTAIY